MPENYYTTNPDGSDHNAFYCTRGQFDAFLSENPYLVETLIAPFQPLNAWMFNLLVEENNLRSVVNAMDNKPRIIIGCGQSHERLDTWVVALQEASTLTTEQFDAQWRLAESYDEGREES